MDKGRPSEIRFEPYAGEFCRLPGCTNRTSVKITWRHFHRGVVKTAERERCREHARAFAKKHGVSWR